MRSSIKPQLLNVSTSGSLLSGAIIERDREQGPRDSDGAAVKAARHLLVVHQGSPARLDWRQDGARRSEVFAGEAILNPLGLFLAPRWQQDVELLLLAFEPALVNHVAEDMGRQHVELVPHIRFDDEVVRALTGRLIAEFERDTPADRIYAQSLTYTLVAHLLRHYSVGGIRRGGFRGGLPPSALRRVLDYAHAHLAEPLTLDALAEVAGYSPSHFTTLFKRATGLAPHRYLLERRLAQAQQLLTGTKLSIAEVASATGFADQSHLTRALKRWSGLTPRLLRHR